MYRFIGVLVLGAVAAAGLHALNKIQNDKDDFFEDNFPEENNVNPSNHEEEEFDGFKKTWEDFVNSVMKDIPPEELQINEIEPKFSIKERLEESISEIDLEEVKNLIKGKGDKAVRRFFSEIDALKDKYENMVSKESPIEDKEPLKDTSTNIKYPFVDAAYNDKIIAMKPLLKDKCKKLAECVRDSRGCYAEKNKSGLINEYIRHIIDNPNIASFVALMPVRYNGLLIFDIFEKDEISTIKDILGY